VEHQPSHRGSREPRQALSADTIVAAATPPGRGGIAVVRVSGTQVPAIADALLGSLPAPRFATNARFRGEAGEPIDAGLALYFPEPHSYTGEHVLELHGHGGPVVVELLIARVLGLGARRAQPGEFTQRAYLNGKLDLAQAEAVADLIDAASGAGARAALRSLQGEFSLRLAALAGALTALRVRIEAAIDFSEEDLEALPDPALRAELEAALSALDAVLASSRQGRLLTEGITVAIAGPPNAGKSTLLNRLAGHEAAIVTPIPGTTRDVLRERILIDGLPVLLLDMAGLRAEAGDPIEAEGMRRAEAAMVHADRILFVVDAAADPEAQNYERERARLPAEVPVTLVLNKIDLVPGEGAGTESATLRLSARSGQGIEALREHLKSSMDFAPAAEGVISARARHLEALRRCRDFVAAAADQLVANGSRELVAEELRLAQRALGEIVGEESPDELLGRIFSAFCIGK